MPIDPDIIDDAVEAAVTEGVSSYTVDGETTTAIPLKELLQAKKDIAAQATADTGNPFGKIFRGRIIPPGAGPRGC